MAENKGIAEQTIVVILAAGKGTRMGRADLAKVCFEIEGTAAVNRVIAAFKQQRFHKFLLVVGWQAQQVLDTVAKEHPGVMCVYQEPQLGPGHAAKVAAEALQNLGFDGHVLLTVGARHIESQAVETLVDGYVKQQADMALLTLPARKPAAGGQGRVLVDTDGQVLGIADPIVRRGLAIGGRRYSARQVEKLCQGVNPSLYMFRAEAFYQGIGMIENDNPQGEYNLSDVVGLLGRLRDDAGAPRLRVRAVAADNPHQVQSFNSPDELLSIQDYLRRQRAARQRTAPTLGRPRLKPSQYGTVRQWLGKLEGRKPGLHRWLRRIYGQHESLHRQKCKDLAAVLRCYAKRFGPDEKVCIVRAPGRINLMGRHVDHRGGRTNFLAIDRETIAVVGLRDDGDVVAVNTQPKLYRPVRFNVSELIGRFAWSDWINFVDSDWVRDMVYSTAGDWGNYIKAAVVRLQHRFQDVRIRGLNLALCGNVPIAAGLSSSSTIVVATLQAAIALNGFELTSRQFIDLCGEGEWFVGSRGGAGDHAAIYLGQRGKIAHVGYLPFRVEKIIDAPGNYRVVIANSHVKAAKSKAAKHTFNARIAAYNLGLALLKQRCGEIADRLEHVRDIDPQTLGCNTSDVYRWLLKVPRRMTRQDFVSMLSGEHRELIEANFASHAEPESYNPRGVLLFGAAEIIRSKLCLEHLESGQVVRLGNLMKVSHDGDRVSRPGPGGKYRPGKALCSDEYLHQLIRDLSGESPQKVLRAQLYMQPGSYACSTPEIDQMVDVASAVPGVAGAQIAGAGLGGCIMVLVEKDRVEAVRRALIKHYYRPAGLKPAVLPCIAAEGAGLAEF